MIKVKNIKKVYGKGENAQEVLKDINFSIEKGTICTILGPSGSGKSTLLNILGGIEKMDEGNLIVDDIHLEDLKESKLRKYRKDKLGFIFQFYNLIPNLTIRENIETGEYLSQKPLKLDEVINVLGLKDHERKFPSQISGGQQQRTAIGRAIIKNPDILICDEPTGALDYNTAHEVLKVLQNINKKYGTTIIIATHNQAISKMSNQVLKMHDGYIKENIINNEICDAESLEW